MSPAAEPTLCPACRRVTGHSLRCPYCDSGLPGLRRHLVLACVALLAALGGTLWLIL